MMKRQLGTLAAFKLVWLAVVFSAVWKLHWIGVVAVAAFLFYEAVLRERRYVIVPVLVVGAVGYLIDLTYVQAGLLSFTAGGLLPVPPWMALLWMNFALVLETGLLTLRDRPALAALLGGIGGPLAYSAGVKLGLITLDANAMTAYGAIAATWAVGFPALLLSTRYWGSSQRRSPTTN